LGALRAIPMTKAERIVFLLVWSGNVVQAEKLVCVRYPGCRIEILSHRELRESGWKGQVRALRRLRGEALVFYFSSLEHLHERLLFAWSGILHRCGETSFIDSAGRMERYRRTDWISLLPGTIVAALHDLFSFFVNWVALQLLRFVRPKPMQLLSGAECDLDVAYLFPSPFHRLGPGGAMSHVRGFLGGLKEQGATCEIFASNSFVDTKFACTPIRSKRRFFLFWEASVLSYNWSFARRVRKAIASRRIRALYQRHGRFVIAGALLSQWLRLPLILEFNGFEVWLAKHWDPSRFTRWLKLCEEVSIASASVIVVVSEVLRADLIAKGIEPRRILVNPNAVDPQQFQPDSGGRERRARLGFDQEDVVVTFVGSFSYWHGVSVMAEAIRLLLLERDAASQPRIRFLLIGDGPLCSEVRRCLKQFEESGSVIFSGIIPHDDVVSHLDASDVLLSPHVPMPDGRPFFGSPTKLFEYMSMAKPIVASDLDQIASVLRHNDTAWLVPPGSARDLASAIETLAADPKTRMRLGRRARESVLQGHTWAHNALQILLKAGKTDQSSRPDSADNDAGLHDERTSCMLNRQA